ncbi:hypothetical protein ACFWZ2_08520 [Streptomyces sp. NPDC059002]|uniref:hypothetical protein n=1 Tax=Streptomyces sp. NPDC059002 TaxID=3346690 RepID=UPI00367826C0
MADHIHRRRVGPAAEVDEADHATLSLEKQEGGYVLKATDGCAIPEYLTVVDAEGSPVCRYSAGAVVRSFSGDDEVYSDQVMFIPWVVHEPDPGGAAAGPPDRL